MRKEKQKGGWEKIKVKEDKVKGGRNEWLRKKKREVKKKKKVKGGVNGIRVHHARNFTK